MNKTFKISSIVSNSLIFILVLTSILMMNFGANGQLSASGVEMLKYFTVLSNIFVGFAALLSLIFILKGEMPLWVSLTKYISTISVTITFLTVLFYLGPIYGMKMMFEGAILFMHLITPLLAIAHLFLLEPKLEKYDFRYTIMGIAPVLLYGIFYVVNVAANNGFGNVKYDWYYFGYFGLGFGILMLFVMILFSYLVSIGLYFGFKKISIQKNAS